jgi:hypothetical protein
MICPSTSTANGTQIVSLRKISDSFSATVVLPVPGGP